ncbi:hypothetical protein [Bifidobacterium thermacidophilum]|nr:hypothetical protein [Bifidobacterium thermacidophilum]
MIIFYLVIKNAVRNGIWESGLVDWKERYRKYHEMHGSTSLSLEQLYARHAAERNSDGSPLPSHEIERRVRDEAEAKMDRSNLNVFLGVGCAVLIIIGMIAAIWGADSMTHDNSSNDLSDYSDYSSQY